MEKYYKFQLSMDDDLGDIVIPVFTKKSNNLQELLSYAKEKGANDYHHKISEYSAPDPLDPYGSDLVASARLYDIPETAKDLSQFIYY